MGRLVDHLLQLELSVRSSVFPPRVVALDTVGLVERVVSPRLSEALESGPRSDRVLVDGAVRARGTVDGGGEVELRVGVVGAIVTCYSRLGGRHR